MTIIGIILGVIGAFILTFPLWKIEGERMGYFVRVKNRRKKGKEDWRRIDKALMRLSEDHTGLIYFWTDRKIYLLGSIVTLAGAIFIIVGTIYL